LFIIKTPILTNKYNEKILFSGGSGFYLGFGVNTREFYAFTREFGVNTREFHAFTRGFGVNTREFHAR
jgi:hypothetical protein